MPIGKRDPEEQQRRMKAFETRQSRLIEKLQQRADANRLALRTNQSSTSDDQDINQSVGTSAKIKIN